MMCISSTNAGRFHLSIKASMVGMQSDTGSNTPNSNAIQQIQIGNTPVFEHQVNEPCYC